MTQDHLNPPRPSVIYVLLHYAYYWKLRAHRSTRGLAASFLVYVRKH